MGAERAASPDGRIPAWQGGLSTAQQRLGDNGTPLDPFALGAECRVAPALMGRYRAAYDTVLATLPSRTFDNALAIAALLPLAAAAQPAAAPAGYPPAYPGAPLPVQSADWQLTLLPRGSGAASAGAVPASASPMASPTSMAPSAPMGAGAMGAAPATMGAPPRNLGTLPAKSLP